LEHVGEHPKSFENLLRIWWKRFGNMNIEKNQNQEIKFRIAPKTKAKHRSQLKLCVFIKVGPIKPKTIGQENLT